MKKLTFNLLGSICFFFFTCAEKKDEINPSTSDENVAIIFNTPTNNQQFIHGDTIKINASFSANEDVHEYGLLVKTINNARDSLVIDYNSGHKHVQEATIQKEFVNSFENHTDLIAVFSVATHTNTIHRDTLKMHCHPKGHGSHQH